MNKYQEAKEILEKYDYSTKLELSEGIRNNITRGITVEQFFMMKETCIELLDKETPKKPNKENWSSYCSTCGGYVGEGKNYAWAMGIVYCKKCGVKIDWSEDE